MKIMQDFLRKHPLFCLSTGLFFASLILRTVAVFRDLSEDGYFKGAVHGVSVLLIGLCAILLFVPAFTAKKTEAPGVALFREDLFSPAFFAIPAAGTALFILSLLFGGKESFGTYPAIRTVIAVLVILFLILFILSLVKGCASFFTPSLLVGAVGFGLYPVYLYMEKSKPLNAGEKIVEEFAFLALAVLLLCVSRTDIGRMPYRFFSPAVTSVAFFAFYVSLPLILSSAVRGTAIPANAGTPYLLLTFGVFCVYAIAKVGEATQTPPLHDGQSGDDSDENGEISE